MLDTNFALRATLPIPGAVARKFWVVLSYGAATYRCDHLSLDVEELEAQQRELGGNIYLDEVPRATACDESARLAELLPVGTPSDWVLGGSQACWDEYELKALEVGARFGRDIDPKMAAMLTRKYQSNCVTAAHPPYVYDPIPQLTPDPDDDLLLFDALRMGVDIFISEDRHVVRDDDYGMREYELGEMRLQAMNSNYFLENCAAYLEWDAIDGSWV